VTLGQKISRGIFRLIASQPVDPRVSVLRRSLLGIKKLSYRNFPGRRALVAVQGVEDPIFFGLFAALTLELKSATGCQAALLQVRGVNGAIGTSWLAMILRSWPISMLVNRQWANANADLVGPVAYRSNSLSHPVADLKDWFRAHRLWRSLQAETNISLLTIEGVLVGDLLIDSFLRFRPSPRFDVSDAFVRRVLWQCLRDLRVAKDFFERMRPAIYLSSYSTYIEHGVAARVALSVGTSVFVYGNLNTFGKRLSQADVFHTTNTTDYLREFEALQEPERCLKAAAKQLEQRLSGGVDNATVYMKVSSYASSNEVVPEVREAVVIFLHDFFDSPHVYADMVFPDFWSWVDCTIRTLHNSGIPFWIKPHPNQSEQSILLMDILRAQYPYARFLSPQVTNKQLAEGGMLSGITVYGTVSHELAYFGIPSICCARHPHHPFKFCRTATNVSEYITLLRSPGHCPLSREDMRRHALAFFYMHNLHGCEDSLNLRDRFAALWRTSHDHAASPQDLSNRLTDLRHSAGWRNHIEQLIEAINSYETSRNNN
jgi:hypothetical protein